MLSNVKKQARTPSLSHRLHSYTTLRHLSHADCCALGWGGAGYSNTPAQHTKHMGLGRQEAMYTICYTTYTIMLSSTSFIALHFLGVNAGYERV